MKPKHLVMLVSLAGASWLAFFGDKSPSSGIAEAAARRPQTTPSAGLAQAPSGANQTTVINTTSSEGEPTILVLAPREALIGGAHAEVPAQRLFASQNWMPPPPPPQKLPPPPPPPPPAAPPLPFAYLGKKIDAGIWEVYLTRGDQTFIVQEQTVIEGTYRIDAIKPPLLSITYLPLNQAQTLTIGETD